MPFFAYLAASLVHREGPVRVPFWKQVSKTIPNLAFGTGFHVGALFEQRSKFPKSKLDMGVHSRDCPN